MAEVTFEEQCRHDSNVLKQFIYVCKNYKKYLQPIDKPEPLEMPEEETQGPEQKRARIAKIRPKKSVVLTVLHCSHCGCEFERNKDSLFSRGGKIFCSKKCGSDAWYSAQFIDAICKACQKPFKAKRQHKSREKQYQVCCSKSCSARIRIKKAAMITLECGHCKKTFHRPKRLKLYDRTFCSQPCWSKDAFLRAQANRASKEAALAQERLQEDCLQDTRQASVPP